MATENNIFPMMKVAWKTVTAANSEVKKVMFNGLQNVKVGNYIYLTILGITVHSAFC